MSDTMDKLGGALSGLMKKAREAVETVDKNGTVRGAYERGAERTKAYARMAKLSLEISGENEELRKIFTEIGKLYYEQTRGSAEGFFAPLFAQASQTADKLRAMEDELRTLRDTYAPDGAEKDIEVEIGAFDEVVSADENAAKGE